MRFHPKVHINYHVSLPMLLEVQCHKNKCLVVGHVSWSGTEFGICLDDFIDCLQEIFLCGHLASGSYGKHASLCTYTANLST